MQIVLSILQFIGIALLVLLGIVLVLILIILFYPICYTIEGEMYSEKNAKARVSWLFHLIRARVVYEDDLISAKIGIFWKNIPFFYELKPKQNMESDEEFQKEQDENHAQAKTDLDGKYDETETAFDKSLKKPETKPTLEEKRLDTDTDDISKMQNETEVSVNCQQDSVDIESDSTESEEDIEDVSTSDILEPKNDIKDVNISDVSEHENVISQSNMDSISESQKDDLRSASKDVNRKEKSKFHKKRTKKEKTKAKNTSNSSTSDKEKINFTEKIKGIISKIKGIINKIKQLWSEIKTVITDERNKSAVKHIKDEIISLLKSFLPIKSNVDGTFSIGSPDKTGQVFGIICAFPFIYQNEWSLRPDFAAESAYFEGRFYAKGRIYLYKMVGMVLRILLDKNCRRLYRVIKQFINNVKESNG